MICIFRVKKVHSSSSSSHSRLSEWSPDDDSCGTFIAPDSDDVSRPRPSVTSDLMYCVLRRLIFCHQDIAIPITIGDVY